MNPSKYLPHASVIYSIYHSSSCFNILQIPFMCAIRFRRLWLSLSIVFFYQLFQLEDLRKQRLEDLATLIQKIYRGWKCRTHFLLMKRSQVVIAAWYRRYAVSLLLQPEAHFSTFSKVPLVFVTYIAKISQQSLEMVVTPFLTWENKAPGCWVPCPQLSVAEHGFEPKHFQSVDLVLQSTLL